MAPFFSGRKNLVFKMILFYLWSYGGPLSISEYDVPDSYLRFRNISVGLILCSDQESIYGALSAEG